MAFPWLVVGQLLGAERASDTALLDALGHAFQRLREIPQLADQTNIREHATFIGRERELAELGGAFASSRCVTIVGTGGVGKTRLARWFGWQLRDTLPGGVWFCDLTVARSAGEALSAVARALGERVNIGPSQSAAIDRGNGRLIYLSVPRGLGIDKSVHPVFPRLLAHLSRGQMPLEVTGQVEWLVNRTKTGWCVTLMNPAGQDKPQPAATGVGS